LNVPGSIFYNLSGSKFKRQILQPNQHTLQFWVQS